MISEFTREIFKPNNPKRAMEFFRNKIQFTMGPMEVNTALEENADINLVDVRHSSDFQDEHVPSAINLPEEEWGAFSGLRRDKLNVIYCYSAVCHLAARAAAVFAENGFPVMEMDGGFSEWKHYELPTEKKSEVSAGKETEIRPSAH